jgi:hypothetical protein
MTKKISATAIILLALMNGIMAQDTTAPAAAPAPAPSLKISGSVDAYYRFSPGAEGSSILNNRTSFTNSANTFQLGMASVKAEYSTGKVGVVADLGFGKRAEEFSYADQGTLQNIKQAYVYFAPSDKVKFTFGKFGTHIGYELLDPQLNKNYSMSYMFTNGPFSHTGIKADFTLGGGAGLMLGIANPIDVTSPSSGSDPKTLIAQFSKVAGKLSLYINYAGYFGAKNSLPTASSFNQFGVTASIAASDKFSIGYDGTVQMVKDETISKTKSWWASAVYLNATASDVFGVTLRAEYFSDKKYGIKVYDEDGNGSNVFATTLSGNYKVGGFTLIPELRIDNGSAQIFNKKGGEPTKTAFSAILAAVYSF